MRSFNAGDKVRIARPGRYLEEWQDFEAEVLKADEGNGPYLKPLSERPWGGYASFWWTAEDLELVSPADTKPTLREALDTLKAQEGLCGKFDRIVDLMLDDDPLPRLRYEAAQEDYEHLIPKLEAILNPPVKPKHVYKEGDWVRITAGEARGSVERVERVLESGVSLREGMWYGFHEIEPSPPAVPEKGRWIKATMEDGSTREFEVDRHEDNGYGNIFLTESGDNGFITTNDKPKMPNRNIVGWEYIEAPKPPAKVGDVIKKGDKTPVRGVYRVVGNKYSVLFDAGLEMYNDATLVWIDDDSAE